jgi:monoamine oxidase
MTRRDFLAMSALLGLGTLASPNMLRAKSPSNVIIIGAGAAGLTAGYRLKQHGINFQILEASGAIGGRMKQNRGFADFPLPMGAEWLHAQSRVLKTIVANQSVPVAVKTVGYKRDDIYAFWDGDALTQSGLAGETDRKFVNSSWLDFFESYIVPAVKDQINLKSVVRKIDMSGSRTRVQTHSGHEYSADAVIVTVPLKMLQERRISFVPPLPQRKITAIDAATFWDGYKAFLDFEEPFYPAYTELKVSPETAGQHGFYDAAFGQNTRRNILGVFAVGSAARLYSGQSKAAVTRRILQQLDEIFEGRATPRFRKIITQDWSNERYVGGAYVQDHENWKRVRQLGSSVGSHLHFAGEAYTDGEDWGSVHNAALAAKAVVDQL